jgi:transposase
MEVIVVTGEQKRNIQDMRRQGLSYSQIADSLSLSVNTVKSFCRRNNLSVHNASNDTENKADKEHCKQCDRRLEQTPNSKPKVFCSDQCRHAWWSAHRDRLNRKAVYHLTCAYCGRVFDSYGNKTRKYCCHACYIKDRFGEEARREQRAI